jgi:GrpB-like predicted nucleotidyltransferase (UPF0157 family)
LTLAGRGTQPVEVIDYDHDWPRQYAEERDRIAAAIGDSALTIEHVGGTAVPGLPAKPVIDLMIGVDDFEEHLLFRDWLRAHPQAAEEYGKLKRGLAGRFPFDRDAYRAGKVPFIDTVVAAARREAVSDQPQRSEP